MTEFVAHVDGGARGNPGPAGWGACIRSPDGTVVAELSGFIGSATNNVAEYTGLVETLKWCEAQGADKVHIRSDSLLMVQQMLGRYKVKSPGLQPLHAKARLVGDRIGRVTYEHIQRDLNKDADRLANAAMDEHQE
jgi:ribonuclease HI